jgi:sulfite exporter TauE/SafE
MDKIIISLFILGLSFGCGPCLASCGPLLISYIAGTKKNIAKGLAAYIVFSLSRISAYFILSLLIFFLGRCSLEQFLGEYSKYIFIIGGAFIIFVGIVMTLGRHLDLGFLKKTEQVILERDIKSIVLFGLIIGLLPCAPLIAILSYIGLIAKDGLSSLFYSIAFGLGTALSPLILLVIISGLIPKFITERSVIYYRFFNTICGLIIIFLGIQLIYRGF